MVLEYADDYIDPERKEDLDTELLKKAFLVYQIKNYLGDEKIQYIGESRQGFKIYDGETVTGLFNNWNTVGESSLNAITNEKIFVLGISGNFKIYSCIPFRDISTVDFNDGLTKSSITIQTKKGSEIDKCNAETMESFSTLYSPKFKFRFKRSHSDADAETIAAYIQNRSCNPSSEFVNKKYEQLIEIAEKQGLDEFNIPEPISFDSDKKARDEYEEIREALDKRSYINEKYRNTENTTKSQFVSLIPLPSQFDSAKQAIERYNQIDQIGENILQALDISQTCQDEFQNLPFSTLTQSITQSIESQGLPDEDQAIKWNEIAVESRDILTFLSEVDTTHSSVDEDEWMDQIDLALKEEYPNVLHPIHKKVEYMDGSLWEHNDFESYSWQEFENLVGGLYESLGYETRVTSDTADLGIDVWASKEDEQTAIQAKKYQQDNSVGRETLQKLASTLAKGDADHAVVITTSSFARTAEDYAQEFGSDMEIIDGDELIDMLNNSPMPPPA